MKGKGKTAGAILKKITVQGILDIIGDAIGIQDVNLRLLFQNKIHRKAIGNKIGEYCYKAVHNRDSVCEECHLAKSFKDGMVHTEEHVRTTEEGNFYVLNTASPIKDSKGKIVAGIEVVKDITKLKLAEKALIEAQLELEKRVEERTKELIDANTALKVLIKHREDDKKNFESNILSNIKQLIIPYIEKLKQNRSMSEELVYLNIIESKLKEIVSPFSSQLLSQNLSFSPKEIQIADLIKEGNQDKDISKILNISLSTVKTHRKKIRKKLGIYGKRLNLRTFLLSPIK